MKIIFEKETAEKDSFARSVCPKIENIIHRNSSS